MIMLVQIGKNNFLAARLIDAVEIIETESGLPELSYFSQFEHKRQFLNHDESAAFVYSTGDCRIIEAWNDAFKAL